MAREVAGILSSWWSGKPSKDVEKGEEEDKREEEKKGEEEERGEGEEKEGGSKPVDWAAGIENLVRSVGGYASSLGETVKTTVQEARFISEFQAEQEKFEREQRRQKDAAVPPWVGYNEEEQMKAQILELSADSRNVLRQPPPGVQFPFDFAKSFPIAMAILKEDPRLQKLRFELVPKKVSEERFWCNYFYRVFLIKQSSQLASLSSAEQKGTLSQEQEDKTDGGTAEGGQEHKESLPPESFQVESDVQSPQEEFASDAFHQGGEISRESVKAELGQLGVASSPERKGEESQWEAELQAELQDLELQGIDVGEGELRGSQGDSDAWEAELQEMLDMHEPAQD